MQLTQLINNHLEDIEQLIIIPHLSLHQIPFSALIIEEEGQKTLLGDKYRLRYLPSLQILKYCTDRIGKRHSTDQENWGTIENATNDLPCAIFEGENVARINKISQANRLQKQEKATVENALTLMKKISKIHLAHHAKANLSSPLESILLLGNGTITLGQIMSPGFRLKDLLEVIISCCESALGDAKINDEIITLGAGFLCAGANTVISTLWRVDDLATSLFMIFYSNERDSGLPHDISLQKAQQTMRELTGNELKRKFYAPLYDHLDREYDQADDLMEKAQKERDKFTEYQPEYKEENEKFKNYKKLTGRIYQIQKLLEKYSEEKNPFADNYFWAGFICQGLN